MNTEMNQSIVFSAPLWAQTSYPARLWESLPGGRTRCLLCPRNCMLGLGEFGFCGVRRNVGGSLVTLNYGKSVPMTQESIETEAVFHYAPGEPILSLGNIGCMLSCDFCQNWTTSQARLIRDKDVVAYTPGQIVRYALDHNIRVLSWTYNDPVVWQEFVLETAALARQHGLKNLYKSAFYISEQAIDELLDVMDIFSISLKSMSADFYREVTKGELEPVLQGILQVYNAKKAGRDVHLEISNLCVTGRNDKLEDSRQVTRWMLDNLDSSIPLHFVRFHPDYLYTHVERTSVSFLEEARLAALQDGMQYVYVGNVHGTPSANTYCPSCKAIVVARYGLVADLRVAADGSCPGCGMRIPLVLPFKDKAKSDFGLHSGLDSFLHHFRGPIQSCHVEKSNEEPVYYQFEDKDGNLLGAPDASACMRFMISSGFPQAVAVRIFHNLGKVPRVYEVYDRAHFPVLTAEETARADINVPPAAIDPV